MREHEQSETHTRWREVLKHFDDLRGYIDPIADQCSNIDCLLRSFENEFARDPQYKDNFGSNPAGLQLHIQLSRLWVFSVYEFLRSLHIAVKKHDHPAGKCLKSTNSKGCGLADCTVCSIGHLKNDFAVVRVPMAKGDTAGDVFNPPLTGNMKTQICSEEVPVSPPYSKFLLPDEGMVSGVMCWVKFDKRVDRNRLFLRRDLSDKVLLWKAMND